MARKSGLSSSWIAVQRENDLATRNTHHLFLTTTEIQQNSNNREEEAEASCCIDFRVPKIDSMNASCLRNCSCTPAGSHPPTFHAFRLLISSISGRERPSNSSSFDKSWILGLSVFSLDFRLVGGFFSSLNISCPQPTFIKMATSTLSTFNSLLCGPIFLPSLSSAFSNNKIEWERCRVLEVIRWMTMLIFCCGIWVIRSFLDHFPSSVPASGYLEGLSHSTSLCSKGQDELVHHTGFRFSNSPIGRALSQVLALLNDISVSSEKYEFARSLADKLILDNITQGDLLSKEVNKVALAGSFARTFKLLTVTLEGLQQQEEVETCSWPWKLIRSVFFKGLAIQPPLLYLENFRLCLINAFFPVQQPGNLSVELLPSKSTACTQIGTDCVWAEKLAQELFWIAQKLSECAAIEEAILQWSTASRLASCSISAHPRVQCSLLQVCVLLFKELASTEVAANRDMKFKSLLLWLPLLCCAKNGYDAPMFTPAQKAELVAVLEKIIVSLPDSDQEIVLAIWLQEYILSSSEWPNLQQCYDRWCHLSRKLGFQSGKSSMPKLIF